MVAVVEEQLAGLLLNFESEQNFDSCVGGRQHVESTFFEKEAPSAIDEWKHEVSLFASFEKPSIDFLEVEVEVVRDEGTHGVRFDIYSLVI